MFLYFLPKNFKKSVFLAFPAFLLVFLPFSMAEAQNDKPSFFFIRDLRQGMTGDDVRELQRLLNKDPDTRIPGTGIGSQGLESTYFGNITKEAVVRFQNKYANEVLRPAGLTNGTGNVGLWTRLRLNQILINAQISQTPAERANPSHNIESETIILPESTTISSNPALNTLNLLSTAGVSSDLTLSSLSKYSGVVGSSLTLTGTGFSLQDNTVHFGSEEEEDAVSKSGKTLTVTIPDIQVGRYDISVTKTGKKSNMLPFMVTTPGAQLPVIEKITPAKAKFGDEITITGKNFTSTDNIVSTSVGIVRGLKSPNGDTITFSIPLPDYMKKAHVSSDLDWSVNVMVVNTNGLSKENSASKFTIGL